MLIDGHWLGLMWAVLAGAWSIAALIYGFLVHLSWPADRGKRIFAVLAHAAFAVFFFWKLQETPVPPDIKLADLVRNGVNLFFVIYTMLNGIWAVAGLLERRAQRIVRERENS